jgi:post-segregation antitoxin (ccd killing protein)
MQVYLLADLYELVKKRGLPASELLQEAVRTEMHRRELRSASQRYTTELATEVGLPTTQERARAVAVAKTNSRLQGSESRLRLCVDPTRTVFSRPVRSPMRSPSLSRGARLYSGG